MELCSIASGSSGNCIYVGTEDTHLLVDVGISRKRVEDGLSGIDINPETLDGILVTHEHLDHMSGLGVFVRKYHTPIYATPETVFEILHGKSADRVEPELFHSILPGSSFRIGDMQINPFSISHDAANPVGYTFQSGSKKIGIATDTGIVTETIVENLQNANALLLEANHDVHMLEAGSYPYYLKRRILGELGHLSNENSGILLSKIWHTGLKQVFLGHLSRENNYPDLAYESVRCELLFRYPDYGAYTKLAVASRQAPGEPIFV